MDYKEVSWLQCHRFLQHIGGDFMFGQVRATGHSFGLAIYYKINCEFDAKNGLIYNISCASEVTITYTFGGSYKNYVQHCLYRLYTIHIVCIFAMPPTNIFKLTSYNAECLGSPLTIEIQFALNKLPFSQIFFFLGQDSAIPPISWAKVINHWDTLNFHIRFKKKPWP